MVKSCFVGSGRTVLAAAALVLGAALALSGCSDPIAMYQVPEPALAGGRTVLVLPFMDTRTFVGNGDPYKDNLGIHARDIYAEALRKETAAAGASVLTPELPEPEKSLTNAEVAELGRAHGADIVVAGQIFSFTDTRAASIPPRAGMFVRVISASDAALLFVGDHYQAAALPGAPGGRGLQARKVAEALVDGLVRQTAPVIQSASLSVSSSGAYAMLAPPQLEDGGYEGEYGADEADSAFAPALPPFISLGGGQLRPDEWDDEIAPAAPPVRDYIAQDSRMEPPAPQAAVPPVPAAPAAGAVFARGLPPLPELNSSPAGNDSAGMPALDFPPLPELTAGDMGVPFPPPPPAELLEEAQAAGLYAALPEETETARPEAASEAPAETALLPEPAELPVPEPAAPPAELTEEMAAADSTAETEEHALFAVSDAGFLTEAEAPAPAAGLELALPPAASGWHIEEPDAVPSAPEDGFAAALPAAVPEVLAAAEEISDAGVFAEKAYEEDLAQESESVFEEDASLAAGGYMDASFAARMSGDDLAADLFASDGAVWGVPDTASAPPVPAEIIAAALTAETEAAAAAAAPVLLDEPAASPFPAAFAEAAAESAGEPDLTAASAPAAEADDAGESYAAAVREGLVPARASSVKPPVLTFGYREDAGTSAAMHDAGSGEEADHEAGSAEEAVLAALPDGPIYSFPLASEQPRTHAAFASGMQALPQAGAPVRVLLLPYHDRENPNNLIVNTGGAEVVTTLYGAELARNPAIQLLWDATGQASHDRLTTREEALAMGRLAGADFVIRGQVVEFRRAQSVPSFYSAVISTAMLAAQMVFAEFSGVDAATEVYRVADGVCIMSRRDRSQQKYVVQAEKTVRKLAAGMARSVAAAVTAEDPEEMDPFIEELETLTFLTNPR